MYIISKINIVSIIINTMAVATAFLLFTACNSGGSQPVITDIPTKSDENIAKDFVYYNESHLKLVRERIIAGDSYFNEKYQVILKEGDSALAFQVDPVTNKTQVPPSKNMHDYLTYAPYRWPDESKPDGLPWIARDGIVNPVSRGVDTDFVRKEEFFHAVEKLAWAFYFSNDNRYAEKAIDLIKIWYLNPETKINPHINFGQGVPGENNGSKAGVHEWEAQSHIITALQMFDAQQVLPEEVKSGMFSWFSEYLTWLTTNPMAIQAGLTRQNHANHYSFQVMGLMLYLGKTEEAKALIEDAKKSRIAQQILPDGIQPLEMGRTQSVYYSVLNLWSMTELALMGRKVGVDLWAYESADGRSLHKAYEYLAPFVLAPQTWPYEQITKGGAVAAIAEKMQPLFSKVHTALGANYIKFNEKLHLKLTALQALQYPPVDKLFGTK